MSGDVGVVSAEFAVWAGQVLAGSGIDVTSIAGVVAGGRSDGAACAVRDGWTCGLAALSVGGGAG